MQEPDAETCPDTSPRRIHHILETRHMYHLAREVSRISPMEEANIEP